MITVSKQHIVGSIFPEKLIFENNTYRTPKINEGVRLLCRNSKALGVGKKIKHLKNEMLSSGVERTSSSSNLPIYRLKYEISRLQSVFYGKK
jgi:hypothetical protein